MSVSEDSLTGPGATTTPVRQRVRTGGGVAGAIAGLTGLVVLVAGVGASVSPAGVAAVPGPGSASAGLGVGLLLALIWRDALATVPLAHRVGRPRTGRTVHVELVPAADRPTPAAGGRA